MVEGRSAASIGPSFLGLHDRLSDDEGHHLFCANGNPLCTGEATSRCNSALKVGQERVSAAKEIAILRKIRHGLLPKIRNPPL